MKKHLKFALRTAILVEKQSLDFYLYAAKIVGNGKTRKLFELLAAEEAEHLGGFHDRYKANNFGDLRDLINSPPDLGTPIYRSLLNSVETGTQEKEALEISLREEKACIELYSDLVITINEPGARELFGQALRETNRHCDIIQEEYLRVISMACESNDDVSEHEQTKLIVINPEKGETAPANRSGLNRKHLLSAPEDIEFH